jgi:23S rRNA (cytosine1962-C5)-methyltransferase
MYAQKEIFTEILKEGYGERLKAVYDKSAASLHHKFDNDASGFKHSDSYLYGQPTDKFISENGHRFHVDWEKGQKTGFFIDQRDNRLLLSKSAAGKKVLNTFCYTGGFSVYAASAAASLVHSVDSSAGAIEFVNENIKMNNPSATHQSFTSDVFDFMKSSSEDYDVMVLDPPAFAKGQSARHNAIQAYSRLNQAAFKKIKKGGIVFTFSCSQAVSTEMFTGAVTSAAIDSGRNIKILHHLTQPADHPVSIFCPEGLYLKGLVCYVE